MPIYFPNFVNYVGECGASGGFFCGECEGDCDSNDDCTGDLVCSQRSGIEAVPGGSSGTSDDEKRKLVFTETRVIIAGPDRLTRFRHYLGYSICRHMKLNN